MQQNMVAADVGVGVGDVVVRLLANTDPVIHNLYRCDAKLV